MLATDTRGGAKLYLSTAGAHKLPSGPAPLPSPAVATSLETRATVRHTRLYEEAWRAASPSPTCIATPIALLLPFREGRWLPDSQLGAREQRWSVRPRRI